VGRGKSQKSLELIEAARAVLEEIQPATVRAVCYRLFVAGLIRSMEKKNTSRVSVQLTWAREHGVIPWEWIVDESRQAERLVCWEDPETFAKEISAGYARDLWVTQGTYLEVWSEKGTMRGTLMPLLLEYGVTLRVMHGFSSATTAYDAAQRIADERSAGKRVVILYAGDWDPSGLYMSEVDLPSRLRAYGAEPSWFERVALTESDVGNPDLPYFSAADKNLDPRFRWFVGAHGARCWELDALSPAVLRDRLEVFIRAEIDWPTWNRSRLAEQAETESLRNVLGHRTLNGDFR
jgi:hypothetical protein